MDILYNVDERYLQAIEELNYGELPKALHYFNAIIDTDAGHARAHYQLGCCYYYHFKNYQTAGYYLKKCIALEPEFPDAYIPYLKLLVTLNMHQSIQPVANAALLIPGVPEAGIYETLGNYAERNQKLDVAKQHYQKAALATIDQAGHKGIQDHLTRVADKQQAKRSIVYEYQD